MSAAAPRQRREGWPWPAGDATAQGGSADAVLRQAHARLSEEAHAVARITDELGRALERLEDAQRLVRAAAEGAAADEAGQLIARARQRVD